jgi:hypothetical protein
MRDHGILPARRGGRASTIQLERPVARRAGAAAFASTIPNVAIGFRATFRKTAKICQSPAVLPAALGCDLAGSGRCLRERCKELYWHTERKNAASSLGTGPIFLLGTFLSCDLH